MSLSTLLDGHTGMLPDGCRELDRADAADLAGRLLSHAVYAPAACTGWMHADLHPGNFLLLPGGRLGMLDFGAVPTRAFHLAYSPGFRGGSFPGPAAVGTAPAAASWAS